MTIYKKIQDLSRDSGDVVDFVDFLFFNREGVKNAKGVFVGFPI